jgi:hypothetical protein
MTTGEKTMSEAGVTALAVVVEGAVRAVVEGKPPLAAAADAWPQFRTAVAQAFTELKEEELEGVARWREGRHMSE